MTTIEEEKVKQQQNTQRVCQFFNTPSGCHFGNNCCNLHVSSIVNTSVNKLSQSVCRYFNKLSGCKNGDRCGFLHIEKTDLIAPLRKIQEKWLQSGDAGIIRLAIHLHAILDIYEKDPNKNNDEIYEIASELFCESLYSYILGTERRDSLYSQTNAIAQLMPHHFPLAEITYIQDAVYATSETKQNSEIIINCIYVVVTWMEQNVIDVPKTRDSLKKDTEKFMNFPVSAIEDIKWCVRLMNYRHVIDSWMKQPISNIITYGFKIDLHTLYNLAPILSIISILIYYDYASVLSLVCLALIVLFIIGYIVHIFASYEWIAKSYSYFFFVALRDALDEAGYDEKTIFNIKYGNLFSVLNDCPLLPRSAQSGNDEKTDERDAWEIGHKLEIYNDERTDNKEWYLGEIVEINDDTLTIKYGFESWQHTESNRYSKDIRPCNYVEPEIIANGFRDILLEGGFDVFSGQVHIRNKEEALEVRCDVKQYVKWVHEWYKLYEDEFVLIRITRKTKLYRSLSGNETLILPTILNENSKMAKYGTYSHVIKEEIHSPKKVEKPLIAYQAPPKVDDNINVIPRVKPENDNAAKPGPKQISIIAVFGGQKKSVVLQNKPTKNVYEYTMDTLRSKLEKTFAAKGLKGHCNLQTDKGQKIETDQDIVQYLPLYHGEIQVTQ